MAEPIELKFIVTDVDTTKITSAVNAAIDDINSTASKPIELTINEKQLTSQIGNIKKQLQEIQALSAGGAVGGKGSSGGKSSFGGSWGSQVAAINKSVTALERRGVATEKVTEAQKALNNAMSAYKTNQTNDTTAALKKQYETTQQIVKAQKQALQEFDEAYALRNRAAVDLTKSTSAESMASAQRAQAEANTEINRTLKEMGVSEDQVLQTKKQVYDQEQKLIHASEQRAKAEQRADDMEARQMTRRNQDMLSLESYYQRWGMNIQKNTELQAKYNTLLSQMRSGEYDPSALSKFRLECKEAGIEVESIGQKIKRLFGQRFGYLFSSMAFTGVLAGLRGVWSSVKEIDVAMTELRKVTDETEATYSRFLSNAGTRAQDIGATVSDVVQSTAEFARLGYNLNEATQMSDSALVLKNVGDGITDIQDASQKMISVIKAFPEFENNSMGIVDKMNEVGKQYCPAA